MNNLSLSLLGSFQATLDENPITQFRTKSVQALLIYLVCEAERPHHREALMELLWPGMPQASAQARGATPHAKKNMYVYAFSEMFA